MFNESCTGGKFLMTVIGFDLFHCQTFDFNLVESI